ncbi:F-box/LRR-repeat protein [Quillaja saponaria]|uniref:F-box/LRR-repeat protein n=1 Tax=Quillaja saponaria TaxID=32244 RepID=A0AAD7LJ32_QUISA|nr:F-box/LRR-repeat protein [Quillaja saponaria]
MSILGDDELALILNWVYDQNERKWFSQVCKQWLRVEGLTRQSIRVLEPESLLGILPRFPNLVRFESSKVITNDDVKFLAQKCPKIEVLNLNFKIPHEISDYSDELCGSDDVGDEGLSAWTVGCHRLREVLLRRRKNIGNAGIIPLVNTANNLTHLDLGWCNLIADQALETIGAANLIAVLNLQGCSLITDHGLASLAFGSSSRSLKSLNLAECDRISDLGVSLLQKITSLEELNMAECGPKVTDLGCLSVSTIQTLKKMNLSWLVNVSDTTVVALAVNCPNLVSVDLTGCELITGAGIRAFANHGSLEALVLSSCYNVFANDLEFTVIGCKSLRYIVLAKGLRIWIPPETQENITRTCYLCWR